MRDLDNGGKLMLVREGAQLIVYYFAANGTIVDAMRVDTLQEAQAAMEIGPDRW